MACGKPVIGGKYDGSREPLRDGKLGYMIDPGDVDQIVGAIREASSKKGKRNNPEYLREQVKEYFGADVFNKRVKEVYNRYIV